MRSARWRAETTSGSARGSIGSARIWDEATRSARRARPSEEQPVGSAPAVPEAKLAKLVAAAVHDLLRERFPDEACERRTELGLELQARILGWLILRDPAPAPPDPAPSAPVPVHAASPTPVPTEPPSHAGAAPGRATPGFPGGTLGRLLFRQLSLAGGLLVEREELMGRLIELALESVPPPPEPTPNASPEVAEELDRLRRRAAKLERALEEARAALAYVSRLERVEEGSASIYRAVQGLAANDPLRECKRQALELLFRANLELQRPGA